MARGYGRRIGGVKKPIGAGVQRYLNRQKAFKLRTEENKHVVFRKHGKVIKATDKKVSK